MSIPEMTNSYYLMKDSLTENLFYCGTPSYTPLFSVSPGNMKTFTHIEDVLKEKEMLSANFDTFTDVYQTLTFKVN